MVTEAPATGKTMEQPMEISDLDQLVMGLTMTASPHLPMEPTIGSVVQVVAVATAAKKGKQYI